ncbi:MAG TPA: hypothetical protein VNO33_17330 [Kofleriaceae bacterium]|nr:hypothetical protein [Kofleriaceae bacterium]
MAQKEKEDKRKAAAATERAARERYEEAVAQIREGSYRFSSKVRGQAGLILDELIDPEGEVVATLADVEGDVGALALAMPLDLITFETWLLGQIGDEEHLDLDLPNHRELWFNFGAWIGEALRLRHGGHWLTLGEEPKAWRLGFSKILLEVVPHQFAEQLLRLGSGVAKKLVSEVERLRAQHHDQREKDGGVEIDRFTAQHYFRMHTMPLGQWMVMDLPLMDRLWNRAAARDLIKEVRKSSKRLGEANAPIIDKVVEAIGKANQEQPLGLQTGDRGLFEAVAQIIALRRTTAPLAMDVLERYVMPAMHIGIPDQFPPLDDDDLAQLRRGIELFALFVDVIPHKHQADDSGFMGAIPNEDMSTPYRDRSNLEVGRGDWVIVNPRRFKAMLLEFDSKRLLDKYDEFIQFLHANPKAPRRRDDGRLLAETTARALGDFRACVVAASKEELALVFRLLPPPG